MKKSAMAIFCFVNILMGYSQTDIKPVVGIAEFTKEVDSKYAGAVAEKVVEIVANTKRFTLVDRTSYDKVKKELEFQKSEAFLDSKNTVKQDAALAAEFIIIGHIVKMNVYTMKNPDGSINGYKSSVAFNLKVNEVETGKTTEAESFQSSVSPLMLSPESAVNKTLESIESALSYYFIKTFPLTTRISKILSTKKATATNVLVAGGKSYGFKEGDRLTVEIIEVLDGRPYHRQIGEIKIIKLAGDDFSECKVISGGRELLLSFQAAEKLQCKLIVK
jgi:hypothetical protein